MTVTIMRPAECNIAKQEWSQEAIFAVLAIVLRQNRLFLSFYRQDSLEVDPGQRVLHSCFVATNTPE